MANANVPRGLIPVRHTNGNYWTGAANIYFVPSGYGSNIFVGDPVVLLSTNNDANGIPGVTLASAGTGDVILGSMVGIVAGGMPTIAVTRDQPIYHPASTAQYILVSDDPTLLYEIQDDGTGTAANTWSSNNANLTAGSGGSTVTGYSSWQISGSSVATGNATYQVKILRLLDQPDNAEPPTANAKWLVRLNQYQVGNGTIGY